MSQHFAPVVGDAHLVDEFLVRAICRRDGVSRADANLANHCGECSFMSALATIPIDDIRCRPDARPLNNKALGGLTKSIDALGLMARHLTNGNLALEPSRIKQPTSRNALRCTRLSPTSPKITDSHRTS